MAAIPIHNETDYPLTDIMTAYILRDAHEHFGEELQAIRVQSGLERHAFNIRTHEVRYAFSPQDFGFGPTMPPTPEPPRAQRRASRRAVEPEVDILPASLEDGEEDIEEAEPLETSLESLEEGHEDEDEEDLFTLDALKDDEDEEEEDNEDDEDDRSFDPDAYGA